MHAYVIGTWRAVKEEDEFVNRPAVFLDYPQMLCMDVTGQSGPEIAAEKHLCVFLVEAEDKVIAQISEDPLYKVLPVEGKLTQEETDDLKTIPVLAEEVEKLPPDADRSQLKDLLVTKFRQQTKEQADGRIHPAPR